MESSIAKSSWRIICFAFVFILGSAACQTIGQLETSNSLDVMLGQLQEKNLDDNKANKLELKIWHKWMTHDAPLANELMKTGLQQVLRGYNDAALISFSILIERFPSYSEAWNKRATTYYHLGDFAASMDDIQHVLYLEPRHFGALSGLGLILDELDDLTGALRAYQAALNINPHMNGIKSRLEDIKAELYGKPI
jgi:tetratricopeptide (TPR) repeat protein